MDSPSPASTSPSATAIEVADLPASADLGAAVARAPGAQVHRLGGLGDWSSVSLRGSSAEQVEVFVDGIPLNPDGGGAVDLSQLPLQAFERVEVYRGSLPLVLGGAPMGGGVNLVVPGAPATAIALSGGSFGTTRGALTTGANVPLGASRARLWLAAEGFATRGDYRVFDDRGTWYNASDDQWVQRANNDKRQGSAWASARVHLGPTTWTLMDGVFARERGLPGSLGRPLSQARTASQRHLLTLRGEGGGLAGTVWLLDSAARLSDPAMEVGPGVAAGRTQSRTLGASTHGAWPLRPWLSAQAMVDGRQEKSTEGAAHQRAVGRGAVALTMSNTRQDVIFVPALHLSKLGPEDALLLPRAELRVKVSPAVALATHAGRGARPATLQELLGDQALLVGNPDLLPERGWQADAGMRYRFDGADRSATVELAVFGAQRDELIVIAQNAQGLGRAENRGRARVVGVELAADLSSEERWGLDGQLTLQQAVDISEGSPYEGQVLPMLPWLDAGLQGWTAPTEALRFASGLSYTSASYHDALGWFRSAPRPLVEVSASLRPSERWSVELGVLNALDKQRELIDPNPLDLDADDRAPAAITDLWGFPLPGRTAMLTLHFTPGGEP